MSDLELIKKVAEYEASLRQAYIVSVSFSSDEVVEILADTDPGIRLSEIIDLSRAISQNLPETITNRYSIEVSSPGVGKPLLIRRQYLKNVGRLSQISLKDGSVVIGRIKKVTDSDIEIEEKPKNQKKGIPEKRNIIKIIPFSEISETRIKVEF